MAKYYVDCGTEIAEIVSCGKKEADYVDIEDYESLEQTNRELVVRLKSYEQMHERAVKDVQEYSKALEIITLETARYAIGIAKFEKGFSFKKEDHSEVELSSTYIQTYLEQARKELANG